MKTGLTAALIFITAAVFAQQQNKFPQNFVGSWKGALQWMVAGKPTKTFTM